MSSQSLPSFAQAFSAIDDRDRALPPIHSYIRREARSHSRGASAYAHRDETQPRHDSQAHSHSHPHHSPSPSTLPPLKRESRKRPLERDDNDSEPESPRIVKQEQDVDQLDPSPPPSAAPPTASKSPPTKPPACVPAPSPARATRARQQLHLNTNVGNDSITNNTATNSNTNNAPSTNAQPPAAAAPLPPPSLPRHPAKRRRVTISGIAHPSSAYTSISPAHSNAHTPPPVHTGGTGPSTPISPVVMGFTIQRDPQTVQQVKAMLAVKEKQKQLIESRRGSAAGLVGIDQGRRGSTAGVEGYGRRASVAAPSVTVNVVNPTPTSATPPAPTLRRTGSSPNGHRLVPTPPSLSPNARGNANRTRSPSLLGSGARAKSPSGPQVAPAGATSMSPPSHPKSNPHSNGHPHSHSHSHPHVHPQVSAQPHAQANPHSVSARPHTHVPMASRSPPQMQAQGNAPGTASNLANPGANANASAASSPLSHARPNPTSQNQGQPQSQGQNQSQSQSQNQQSFSPSASATQGLSALAHNLPPPPNSFTRRRAGTMGLHRGNKPADLMITSTSTVASNHPHGSNSSSNKSELGSISVSSTGASAHNKGSGGGPPGHHASSALSLSHSPHSHSHSQSHSHSHSQLQGQGQGQQGTHRGGMGMHVPSIRDGPVPVPLSSSYKSLPPAIQSAPPRPGQQPGRFPMTLPSLPPAISQAASSLSGASPVPRGTSVRKTTSSTLGPGQVPPTPTRLSMQRAQGTTEESASVRLSQPTGFPRVPRTATGATFAVPHGPPLGMGGMPKTPATLNRPSGNTSAEKAAFLAPFEQFYDALSDAQVLKGWFGEQLRRVGALAKEGEAQLSKLKVANSDREGAGMTKKEVEAFVREAVVNEARGWREEVGRLRTQVADLQDLLVEVTGKAPPPPPPRSSKDVGGRHVNGLSPRPPFQPTPPTSTSGVGTNVVYPSAPGVESYTFPPVPRPPTAPAHPPASHAQTHYPPVDEQVGVVSLRQSVSPPFPSTTFHGGGGRAERGRDVSDEGTRSVSRSAASSPAPSLDGGIGIGSLSGVGGVGRKLSVSVSAMRFEPRREAPLPPPPPTPSSEKEKEDRTTREKGREKEKDGAREKEKSSKSSLDNDEGSNATSRPPKKGADSMDDS